MSYQIRNRRYTGSKYKLASWIAELIADNCTGKSFCDLFAGTAVVSKAVIDVFDEIYINDFLYSNEIIYRALCLSGFIWFPLQRFVKTKYMKKDLIVSKSKNAPFIGKKLKEMVKYIIVCGKIYQLWVKNYRVILTMKIKKEKSKMKNAIDILIDKIRKTNK